MLQWLLCSRGSYGRPRSVRRPRRLGRRKGTSSRWRMDGHLTRTTSRGSRSICKEGEPLPELTFHGLRHTCASLMLAGGADISTVSKLLGHASISITADVY